MLRRPRSPSFLALAALLLVACAPAAVTTVESAPRLPPHDLRLAQAGDADVRAERASLRSVVGCEVAYEVLEPAERVTTATAVIAHGFLRDLTTMRGWAEHFASHGVRSVVVSFCASSPFAGRHDRNALDLRAVADAVAGDEGSILYVGFSAGGLSALLAAAEDARTTAYLGLDAVDGRGGRVTSRFEGPALFLAAEPSACNAQGSLLEVAAELVRADAVRIPAATHCHFEDPYAPLCERLCGRVEPPEAAGAIRAAIRALATEFVLQHAR
jgi:dienelactone hydrolase